jgi:hypothetical protein
MNKNIIKVLCLVLIFIMLTGCTNGCVRRFGGTQEITLPKDQKLINITWKDNDLWILTKPMSDSDDAEEYEYREYSNYGIMEGKVIIKEVK